MSLTIEHKNFLGIKYYRTHLKNQNIREIIIKEIRDTVFHDVPPNKENSLILGIVAACKIHKVVCANRSEIKDSRRKLKEIMKSDAIAQSVDQVIREMHAAVMGAIVATSAGAAGASR